MQIDPLNTESYIIALAALLLWLLIAFLIKKRASGWPLLRRLMFSALGIIGLLLLIVRPTYDVSLNQVELHLITPHAEIIEDSTSVFQDVHKLINSSNFSSASKVNIYGIGLSKEELTLLNGMAIEYHPVAKIDGFLNLEIPTITEGEKWKLKGEVQGEGYTDISFKGPSGVLVKGALSEGAFSIESVAPAAGEYLTELSMISEGRDTIVESLPLFVRHQPNWNMLVLSSFPNFESNYLKNYWTSLGYGFAMRTKVSRDKYQSSFTNMSNDDLSALSSGEIKKFDFIITDVPSWNQLSNQEQSRIIKSIRDDGLGLILKPSASNEKAVGLSHPSWSDQQKFVWTTKSEDIEMAQYPIQSNWTSARYKGQKLATYTSLGLGHVMVLSVDETYKLVLNNEPIEYQSLWSTVFSNLYSDFSASSSLVHDQWLREGEHSKIQILTPKSLSKQPVLNDSLSLSYLKLPFIDGAYEVDVSPVEGRNTISIGDQESKLSFYAHGMNTWQALRQLKLKDINQAAANNTKSNSDTRRVEQKEISIFWWYVLMLLGFGALWLDERLLS